MSASPPILSPFPDFFTFSVGALNDGDWWEVTYVVNSVRYRAGNSSTVLPSREALCTPDAAHWALFWQALDRIGVWNWKPDYTDPNVLDGQGWSLEIQHAGRKIKTGGANAYPGVDGSAYSPDTAFGQFLAVVEELTGLTGLS